MNWQTTTDVVTGNNAIRPYDLTRETAPSASRLADRVRGYLARHPEVTPEEFLRSAVGREMAVRLSLEHSDTFRIARHTSGRPSRWAVNRRPPSASDLRIHAQLAERTLALHHERYGLWPRIKDSVRGRR